MIKVSVIVPAYNVNSYIKECVSSIQKQTFKNIEILLVNDGSTDFTGLFCDQLAHDDPRIKVIHQANGGVSNARNTGVANASGDYLMFVDADDQIHHQMVETLVSQIDKFPGADIVACQLKRFSTTYEPEVLNHNVKSTVYNSHEAIEELMYQRIINGPVAKLFSRSAFEGIEFPEGIKIGEDLITNINAFGNASTIVQLPFRLYGYFMRAESAMHSSTFYDRTLLIEALLRAREDFKFSARILKSFDQRIFNEAFYSSLTLDPSRKSQDSISWAILNPYFQQTRKSIVLNNKANLYVRLLAASSWLSIKAPRLIAIARKQVSLSISKLSKTAELVTK